MRYDVAETRVRLPEPVGEHSVFGNAIENAVRSHDRGVHRARKNQRANHHDECVENQPRHERPVKTHGQPADQVLEELRPRLVGNDHHREERNQRREDHAVDENDQRRLLEVRQLGMLDFAVHLRQRLLAAHGQHRVAQPDEHCGERDQMRNAGAVQPSQRARRQQNIARDRSGRQLASPHPQGVSAPRDQHDHHHRGELHDPERFFARFGNPLDVLPPEIERHYRSQTPPRVAFASNVNFRCA